MSFILDALKKSETDRQQRSNAEFAGIPASSERRQGPPAWLWVVAGLLLINLAVLVGILMRPDTSTVDRVGEPLAEQVSEAVLQEAPPPTTQPPASQGEAFASQVATARENAPARAESTVDGVAPPPTTTPLPAAPPTRARQPVNTATLPTLQELLANGAVSLPELHVDIHVYSENAGDRFVFINMVKHKEGSRLAEGPLVEEITPDGVVLNQDGMSFLLPRD
jgi:general secretion pathway protein B